MFKNYLKIAFRNLWKRKVYSIINISGLAVGITACLLILLYVQDEYAYDKFHGNSDRIYRTVREMTIGGETGKAASSNYSLQDLITENIPAVEKAARIAPRRKSLVTNEELELEFIEEKFFFGEETVLEVFDFDFVAGNPATALKDPFSVVITTETAERYFPGLNAVNRTLRLDNDKVFTVTAVVEPYPANAHFHFDFLASLKSTKGWYPPVMFEHWGNMWVYNYLLLQEGANPAMVNNQLRVILETHGPESLNQFNVKITLQPLEDIHLYSNLRGEIEQNGSITFVNVFMIVAVLVLLIACFNFVNLATARSAWRAKEVGVRKVVGAVKSQLITQFLAESILIVFVAAFLGLIALLTLLPAFNDFSGKALSLDFFDNGILWLTMLAILVIVGVVSGAFPAFMLSRFKPVQVLKGKSVGDQKSAAGLRKVLVVVQFSISIILIIGTLVVQQQLQYMKDKDLGFEQEQVIVVPLNSKMAREKVEILKDQFRSNANVAMVSAASDAPPSRLNAWRVLQEGAPESAEQLIDIVAVDYNYLETLDIEMVEGRALSSDFGSDEKEGILMNEAAIRHLGLDHPLGTRFDGMGIKNFNLIGVVKDFHFSSLHEEIKPLILHIWPSWYKNILVKVKTDNLSATIAALEDSWNSSVSDWAFEYHFLDVEFGKLYQAEERLEGLVTFFSLLTVFIAGLGLFGLASFMAEQKIKEIGIRKVLGASVSGVVWLQFRLFLLLIVVSMIIAIPLGYYSAEQWLQDFAYRIEVSWWIYALSALLTIAIALFSVGYQTLKAAISDPVKSLRYE